MGRRPAGEPRRQLGAPAAGPGPAPTRSRRPPSSSQGGAGARTQRLAAAAGYVATEIAKEAPYYAGAFGAAALTDSVSSNRGADLPRRNEPRGRRLRVRPRSPDARARFVAPRCASFDTDWVPRDYLADYYRVVEPDERETIAYFADAMKEAAAGEAVLLFGTGPTLHHVFLAAPKASEIHLADYLPANLEEIERWRTRDPARPRLARLRPLHARMRRTHGPDRRGRHAARGAHALQDHAAARGRRTPPGPLDEDYATVISAYCADSATDDRAIWETLMANITGLVGPGGLFITAALRRCRSYVVGDRRFPSANVDEHDLRRVLAPGFSARVQVRELQGHEAQGYSSVVLADARRRGSGSKTQVSTAAATTRNRPWAESSSANRP